MSDCRRSDTELVASALSGDHSAWDDLIDRYHTLIYGVAVQLGAAQPDAEDIFQNVCLTLYQHLRTLRDSSRISRWLVAVTRQEVLRLRRRRTETSLDAIPEHRLPILGSELDAGLMKLEREHVVRLALRDLSPECRALLEALYGEDEASYEAVARKLGLPLGSIGPKRGRCLARLRERLASHGY
jgi:RNA polymerase sigma factor (sigma-70 family)